MTWTYQQSTGNLTAPDGTLAGQGYSGNGPDLNNAASEDIMGHGPIPQGSWQIRPFFNDPGGKGPIVAHLIPHASTDTMGRAGFMIHGDNAALNHSASDGCIILAHPLREEIATSGDTALLVVA
jgi:Protein of unknown function (DUF2778)